MIHLLFTRGFGPLLFLLLGGHLILNNDRHSCLAIRFPTERHTFDSDELVDQDTDKRLMMMDERAQERELDQLTALDRNTRKPTKPKFDDVAMDRISQLNENHKVDESWLVESVTGRAARLESDSSLDYIERAKRRNDTLFLMVVGTCSLVGIVGLVAAAIFWYKIQKRAESAMDDDYPSYGVSGLNPNGSKLSSSSAISDRKLAQSAQMFHYQQQRQQMMAQEKAHLDTKPLHPDDSDDDAPGVGDYTVYECPGLAPTGEMEVRNPLFAEPDSSLILSNSNSHPTTNSRHVDSSTSIPPTSSPSSKEKSPS